MELLPYLQMEGRGLKKKKMERKLNLTEAGLMI